MDHREEGQDQPGYRIFCKFVPDFSLIYPHMHLQI